MFHINESETQYRFGASGPKYLARGPRTDFGLVVLQPGEDFQAHYHKGVEEAFFTLEGEVCLYVNGEPFVRGPGDYVRVDPGEVHYLVNRGQVSWKAIFVKAPYDSNDKVDVDMKP